jgi:hypothetical protein
MTGYGGGRVGGKIQTTLSIRFKWARKMKLYNDLNYWF